MEKKKHFNWGTAGFVILVLLNVVYGILLVYLHYHQLLFEAGGLFEADTPYHVKMAVDDHWYYSFTAFVYVFLYSFPFGNILTAIFLSLCEVGTIFATYLLIKEIFAKYGMKVSGTLLLFGATSLNFVMAFYIKSVNERHYIGYQNASIWHNSTYICMKLVSVFVLWYFIKLADEYKTGLKITQWIGFTLLLALATGIKPSFLMVFAPAMALMLLKDLICGTKARYVFSFGFTVVLSLVIVLWQNVVLFGEETGNSFVIRPFYALSQRSDNPKIALLCSVLFPFIVGIFHIKDVWKDKLYLGSLMIWGVGFLEVFLFAESGNRSQDGNFMWGYSISLFVLFIISFVRWIRDWKISEFSIKNAAVRYGYLLTAGGILLWHIISGVWFFGILLTGATYFA